MRHLVRILRQRLVMELPCRVGVEAQVELVLPAEVEPRPADRVVAQLGGRMAFREVGGMGGDPVGDHSGLHVVRFGRPRCSFGVT